MNNTINSYRQSLGYIESKEFYRKGNLLYYGDDRVTPEFAYLSNIPFINHTTIRFFSNALQNENSNKIRYDIIQKIIEPINKKIKRKFPSIITGNKTFRYCWVNEFGESENEVHLHILGFIKPDLPEVVKSQIYQFLKYQCRKYKSDNIGLRNKVYGIESVYTTTVKKKKSDLVSYFCKIENRFGKDTFKQIEYSVGCRSVIEKFYPNTMGLEFFDSVGYSRRIAL